MNIRFPIVKRAYMWLSIGLVLLLGAWTLFFMNLRLSVEFTGGMQMKIDGKLDEKVLSDDLKSYLNTMGYTKADVLIESSDEISSLSLKLKMDDDKKVKEVSESVQNFLIENEYISSDEKVLELSITGPSVGTYMKTTAFKAISIGLLLMVIYMIFAFSTIRKYVSPGILALITVVTMIVDISIPAGAYGFLMMVNSSISVDTIFIVAILTVMGYSINDTIIIFDRIRENMQLKGTQKDLVYGQVIEDSLRQTMRRSIGTSLSTFLVILAMYVLGTGVLKNFAFTMGIGVLAGSFSSIFISAPLAYLAMGKFKKEKGKIK